MTPAPFHGGELEAQERAGGGSPGGNIRDVVIEQHRVFFAQLPFVVVAGRDGDGWPLATILSGAPGFVSAPNPKTLVVATAADPLDPASPALVAGAPIGVLGIELATRRRNRANGVITAVGPDGLRLAVRQSFGNCPQYIHPRDGYRGPGRLGAPSRFQGLDADARAAVARADTFFVASGNDTDGLDISHRGGPRGFVSIDGDTLVVPDYSGNRYFNTLGNFLREPRAALVVPDFERGGLLHLQGTVAIEWEGPEVEKLEGAERLWRVKVDRGYRRTRMG